MPWYRMPTGHEARRLAAAEQAMAHLDAAECVVALAGSVDSECRTPLLAALREQLDCASAAVERVMREA